MPLTLNSAEYNEIREIASVTADAYPDSRLSGELYAGSAIATVFALAGVASGDYDGLSTDKQTHLKIAVLYTIVQLILPQQERVSERRAGAYAVKVSTTVGDRSHEFQRIIEANIALFKGVPPSSLVPSTGGSSSEPERADAVPFTFAKIK